MLRRNGRGTPNTSFSLLQAHDERGSTIQAPRVLVGVVPIERMDDIFAPHVPPLDAFVASAERGSAYTLLHPEYSVAVPKPRPFKVPLAYVIAGRDRAMAAMVDTWIELKRKDGTIDELFAHWILGQDAAPKRPRWSVMDNVLRRAR